MKKNTILRVSFYIAGLLILALGIILNTKSGLGFAHRLIGIGLGTVVAVLGVGQAWSTDLHFHPAASPEYRPQI